MKATIKSQQVRYQELEAKVTESGLLDLVQIQNQIRAEAALLADVQGQIVVAQQELQSQRALLHALQQQILGAEDPILLESFSLYEPKYQRTNCIDYTKRLDELREVQKSAARGIGAEVDAWD